MPMIEKKKRTKYNVLRITITFILLLFFVKNFGGGGEILPADEKIKNYEQLNKIDDTGLTPRNVYQKLIEYKIQHPQIVFSQVMWETGHLKRIKSNNLFGFRNVNYKKFDSWEESIQYAKVWQDRKYNGGDYYTFLKNVKYAEDPNYIINVKKMVYNIFKLNLYELD